MAVLNPAGALAKLLEREGTHISWADFTMNPWLGCQKVSDACTNCYAESLSTARLGIQWGPDADRRRTSVSTWAKVLRWQRIAAAAGVMLDVFCASLADIWDNHRSVDPKWRRDLAEIIRQTPNLRWMLLTKRIGNAKAMLLDMFPGAEVIPENVAFGISICNQEEAERDIPKLQALREWAEGNGGHFPKTFLSIEPQLGPIDLEGLLDGIDLVLNGGESGKDARAMHPMWPALIESNCRAAGVAYHLKQWGEWAPDPNGDRCVDWDGRNMPNLEPHGTNGDTTQRIRRVGVKKAGRLLGGVEYQGRL